MSHKFGFPAMTNRAMGNKSPNGPSKQGTLGIKTLCRVTDIILDEHHPNYSNELGYSQLGTITAEFASLQSTGSPKTYIASPSNSNLKQFPLIGEYVYIYQIPAPNVSGPKWVYDPQPISLYNGLSPNASPFPSVQTDTVLPNSKLTYEQTLNGAFVINELLTTPFEFSLNSKLNPSQNTFIEKSNIRPLMFFAGDVIYEGRWGNSIRLGSTAKSKTSIINQWSSAGENGDPIMVIRNGQDKNVSEDNQEIGNKPIVEDINNDLSSIYLTSYQTLPFHLSNENFNSYQDKPQTPSIFQQPQIIINSDRVVLNAKTDSILISGQKSVGLSSNETLNLESKKIYIDGNDVRIGSKDASQPVLKGDDTVVLLKQIVTEIRNLAKSLETSQIFPGGVPTPDIVVQSTSQIAVENLNKIIARLDDNINGIKSNFVKIK